MAPWSMLPVEVRVMIWETLVDGVAKERLDVDTAFSKRTSIAACAAVGRTWQAFFERVFFRQLVLEGSDNVTRFATICGADPGRLDHIRHLRLHIAVEEHGCQCFKDLSTLSFREALCLQNVELTRAVWPLLATLGTWTPPRGDSPGLVLELSAGSWSDGQHTLHSFRLQRDYPFETVEDLARGDPIRAHEFHVQRLTGQAGQTYHPFEPVHDLYSHAPFFRASVRLRGDHPLAVVPSSIPASTRRQVSGQGIDIVRGLVIRRRFMRSFCDEMLTQLLVLGRRSIRSLRIEEYGRHMVGFWWLCNFEQQSFISSLEAVHIHQEPDPFEIARPESAEAKSYSIFGARPLVNVSRSLRHLSLGGIFSIRASYFFDAALFCIMQQVTRVSHRAILLAVSQEVTKEQLERQIVQLKEAMKVIKRSGRSYLPPEIFDILRAKQKMVEQSRTKGTFVWPHLQTLAIGDSGPGYAVIQNAGVVALEMPQLQILELWSAFADSEPDPDLSPDMDNSRRHENIFLFRFEAASPSHNGLPTVTLRGTRDMRPAWSPEISKWWYEKAKALSIHPLCVEFDRLPREDADAVLHKMPHCGIIKYLLLKDQVLDPVSRSQMELEVLCGA